MTLRMKKFFGNALFFAVALPTLIGLLALMDWVDPWWSTGYNKSPFMIQITALLLWALLGAVVTREVFVLISESRLAPSIPFGFVSGGMVMLVVLIDSSIWLATGVACVVAIVTICALSVLESNRERLKPFLEEG